MLSVKDLFNIQKKFSDLFFRSEEISEREREEITKSFALSLHGKVSSLVDELNIKGHVTIPKDPNRKRMLYLAVDSLRYSIGLMNLWGFTVSDFIQAWNSKEKYLQIRHRISQSRWSGQDVVIFDIDDVISSFRQDFCSWLQNEKNLDIDINSTEYYLLKDLTNQGVSSEGLFEEFMEQGKMALLGREPGIIDLMRNLRSKGVWIHLVTSRPSSNLSCFYDTYKWLDVCNVPFDDISFSPEKMIWLSKSPYFEQGRVVCCIEDSPKHAMEYAKHGVPVVSPVKPYNEELNGINNIWMYETASEVAYTIDYLRGKKNAPK
jgi:hypothetical protein